MTNAIESLEPIKINISDFFDNEPSSSFDRGHLSKTMFEGDHTSLIVKATPGLLSGNWQATGKFVVEDVCIAPEAGTENCHAIFNGEAGISIDEEGLKPFASGTAVYDLTDKAGLDPGHYLQVGLMQAFPRILKWI